jgi:hypothetical protein
MYDSSAKTKAAVEFDIVRAASLIGGLDKARRAETADDRLSRLFKEQIEAPVNTEEVFAPNVVARTSG